MDYSHIRMVSYNINGGDELVGTQYSGKPSIPGPTIIMTEGDECKCHFNQ